MNRSQYAISLNKVNSILKRNSLLKGGPVSFRGSVIKTTEAEEYDYVTAYKKIIDVFDYDFLLFDESILQFAYATDSQGKQLIRYAYYQCPFEYISYEEYLSNIGFFYEEVSDIFQAEYEQELSEASMKENFMHIRYDCSEDDYELAVHPASHLHIGHLSSIRIPIQMIITPYIFTLFVLKQCYYRDWKCLIADSKFRKELLRSKISCSPLDTKLFCELDRTELYLT